jgi:hypothetical protein
MIIWRHPSQSLTCSKNKRTQQQTKNGKFINRITFPDKKNISFQKETDPPHKRNDPF